MTAILLLCAVVVLLCVFVNKLTERFGIPVLLAFLFLGLLFGVDGVFRIPFEDYAFAEKICSVALIFIMFYGGFGTNWRQARPVAVKAGLLSTAGVVLTAALTGLFCHFALGFSLLDGLLAGAVVSSTDAASVFSILRSKKLGLKNHADSLLELESGSNDPCSYMLTVLLLAAKGGSIGVASALGMVACQFAFGILVGLGLGFGAAFLMGRLRLTAGGFDMAFITGVALLAYALASLAGGNGYLSVYLCGLIMGNRRLPNKKALVHFFDGVTGLMQMLIFFLLGLLATPSRIPAVFLPALLTMLFLTFLARPLTVFALLRPFRCGFSEMLLVSFAGLRGAASIVFAIMAIVGPQAGGDLYHIVFVIVLLSISFQGSLLPAFARRIGATDGAVDVMKTFSDYSELVNLQFIKIGIDEGHPWAGQEIRAVALPPDLLIVMLLRGDAQMVPNGKTVLEPGDVAVLSAYQYHGGDNVSLQEHKIPPDSEWVGKTIQDFSPKSGELVIMILRGSRTIVPKGGTRIQKNDVLVIHGGGDGGA